MAEPIKSDLRIIRTKKAIRQTFYEMLSEMDYEKISIKELTKRACINRRTFYLHYSFLDELLEEFMDELVSNYVNRTHNMNGLYDLPEITRQFLLFFAQQDSLHEKIICSKNFRYISDRINQKIIEHNESHIDHIGSMNSYTKDIIITYLNTTVLEIYRKWVNDKKRIPLEDLINLATHLLCHGILSLPKYLSTKKNLTI
ncbi:MAG: TetR family transcriptional regulator [Firmicutes bacterium]|nr:TetR family transcriptional regulator [Bacillota bacterium]